LSTGSRDVTIEPDETVHGRCLCGDIRYEYRGAPVATLHCHCESCRRHTSCPITTFVCVATARLRYTRGTPVVYASSPGVRRTHCGRCGSPIAYESDRHPEQIDLYAGTLVDAAAAQPSCHVHVAEQLPWLETTDMLPRYERGRRGAEPVRHGPRRMG
jgi:hypothetical protein